MDGSYYETPCPRCAAQLEVPVRYDGSSSATGPYEVTVSVDTDHPRYFALRAHFRNHPDGGGEPLPVAA